MRLRIAWTIYLKEIRETLRDRRTLTMMIGLPLVLYPLMIIGMSSLRESEQEKSEARASAVSIWGDAPAELLMQLKGKRVTVRRWDGIPNDLRQDFESGKLSPIKGRPPKEARKQKSEPDHPVTIAARRLVLSRSVDAVLVIWPDVRPSLEAGGLGNMTVLFDSVRPDSEKAGNRLTDELVDYRTSVLLQRERNRGLAAGFSKAIEITSKNVATESRRAGFGLGQILPFLLIAVSFSGAFYSAIDTTAGEKERGTMQTLLCAPLSPTEIIFGKFLSVWTVALIAAAANIASMALTFQRLSKSAGSLMISPENYALAFLMLLPVTLMVTAMFLAAGVFAKDFKDGQNFLMPVLMLILLPSGLTLSPGSELTAWTAFLPVGNISLLMRSLFVGEASPDMIFLTLLASAIYATLAVLFAARVFEREAILLGGKDTIRGVFGLEEKGVRSATPSLALSVFAVVLVSAFYGSLALSGRGVRVTLSAIQLGFFLLPPLALTRLMALPVSETLLWRTPSWRGVAAGLLVGASGWTVAAALLRLMPPPESLNQAMRKVLLLDGGAQPLWVVWLFIAIMPAICEETLFRGLILSGFRRLGPWPAILLSSLLFGLAHSSVYRMLPTALLGAFFGYLAWRTRSIIPGIIAHATNNGILATVAFNASAPAQSLQFVPWTWTAGGCLITALGLLLVSREGSTKTSGN